MHRVKIRVVNLRAEAHNVYIGRPGHGKSGVFGNPVIIGRDCGLCGDTHYDGGSTLPCYEQYLKASVAINASMSKTGSNKVRRAFNELVVRAQTEELVLGCFCNDQSKCHGSVLARMIRAQFCKCGWHPCNPADHAGWRPE